MCVYHACWHGNFIVVSQSDVGRALRGLATYGRYVVKSRLMLIRCATLPNHLLGWSDFSGFIMSGEWRGAFAHIPLLTHSPSRSPPARGDAFYVTTVVAHGVSKLSGCLGGVHP